ncbi:MAG: DUF4920 domain-containing protein [Desulfobacteraceae bacterium]|nr:DUF4920 domain-containing protein [Desulfobacteraceae bacterium]
MKKISILCLVTLLSLMMTAQWAFAEQYGQPLTLTEVTKISIIGKNPELFVDKKVLVKGLVVDVCAKRGCWMDLASDEPFEKIQIKVLDGVIVFPLSAKGKTALVEGVVEELSLSYEEALEHAEHQAEEKGEAFDPSTITGPQTTYRIRALGAEIE